MAFIPGDDNPNSLFGTSDPDTIEGLGGADELFGFGGNDMLYGGAGADVLDGGDGFDFANYSFSTAVIVNLSANSGSGGEAFGDTFASIEGIIGSPQTDLLTGDDGNNDLRGQDGGDVIQGLGGSDNLQGGRGNDVIEGGSDDDLLSGDAGADDLSGGDGNDTATYEGEAIAVSIDLTAGAGHGGDAEGDRLSGIENVIGTAYNDTILGDAAANGIQGFGGSDDLEGGGGNDTVVGAGFLAGGPGNDFVEIYAIASSGLANGGAGADTVEGGFGADTLTGASGNDVVIGFFGADRLIGGTQADIFTYENLGDSNPGQQYLDTIMDFHQAEHDHISLSAIDAVTGGIDNAFRFIGAHAFTGHGGQLRYQINHLQHLTFVQGDVDGDQIADFQVRLMGEIALTASDFVL